MLRSSADLQLYHDDEFQIEGALTLNAFVENAIQSTISTETVCPMITMCVLVDSRG